MMASRDATLDDWKIQTTWHETFVVLEITLGGNRVWRRFVEHGPFLLWRLKRAQKKANLVGAEMRAFHHHFITSPKLPPLPTESAK